MRKYLLFLTISIASLIGKAQNVGINASGVAPDGSAMLDIVATDKGMLIPRVALSGTGDVATITGTEATGLLVYNTTAAGSGSTAVFANTFYFWNGSVWVALSGSGGKDWSITGNAGTTAGTHFLGTTDDIDLQFKRNSVLSGKINNASQITTFGYEAGLVATGINNTFFGHNAGKTVTTGTNNTGVGYLALNLTTGSFNTSIGKSSLANLSTGSSNTALGMNASIYYSTGTGNTAIGMNSLEGSSTTASNTGSYNTAVGWAAGSGYSVATSSPNNYQITTGSYNTFLGFASTANANNYTNASAIGAYSLVGQSNSLILGSIYGVNDAPATSNIGIGTIVPDTSFRLDVKLTNASSGTSWSSTAVSGALIGRTQSGKNYQAGVYGYNTGSDNNSGGVVGAYSSTQYGGLGFRDNSGNVFGVYSSTNADIDGYLTVGNPSAPSSTAGGQWVTFYNHSFDAGAAGWSQNQTCGSTTWTFSYGTNNGLFTFDNAGVRNVAEGISPPIWIPAGTTSVNAEGQFSCTLEDNFDGVYLEYKIGSGAWTKVTAYTYSSYPDNASVSNATCTASNSQSCWNGTINGPFRTTIAGAAGNWLQFRFVAGEDGGNATGRFDLYGFSVGGILPATVGGAFASGNIYAEKNVYAGSNVLVGDVAEHFEIEGNKVEAGDLISINPNKQNRYQVSEIAENPYLIGIVSTAPTVTLNSAEVGKPVALAGRVPVKVCNEGGAIKVGDFLTSASIPGYSKKATKSSYIIGKAIESFDDEKGKILCIIDAGWYNPNSGSSQSSGSFLIKSNTDKVVVNDASIKNNSKVFISFKERVGSDHWISEIKEGSFTLNIGKYTSNNLPFDYFVEQSKSLIADNNENSFVKKEADTKNSAPGQIHNVPAETNVPQFKAFNLESPADTRSAWVYIEGKGMIKTLDYESIYPAQNPEPEPGEKK